MLGAVQQGPIPLHATFDMNVAFAAFDRGILWNALKGCFVLWVTFHHCWVLSPLGIIRSDFWLNMVWQVYDLTTCSTGFHIRPLTLYPLHCRFKSSHFFFQLVAHQYAYDAQSHTCSWSRWRDCLRLGKNCSNIRDAWGLDVDQQHSA